MIRFTLHAREQMDERGILEDEIAQTIETGELVGVRERRQVRRQVFTSGYEREGRLYPHKEVTVIYVEENGVQVVLTSIARYGMWEIQL